MAWNDPGKNQNPWQRRPGQGPPDLDEVVRQFQKKVRSLFGGGQRPPGGGSQAGGRAFGISYIALGLLILWALTGVYQNDAAERSVVMRFGKYVGTTTAGLNWRLPWPIDRRIVVNVTEFRSFTDRTRMLTQDEALVDINLAVQYRRVDPVKFAFNVRDPEATLGEVSESAIREIIGQSKLDFVLELGRQEISAKTKDLVQRTIAAYNTGIEVISVNLQDVSVPEQVAPAQKDAIKAREDKDRSTLSAQTYANDIVPKARGLAVSVVEGARAHRSRVIADAEGETARFGALAAEYERPAVTRERSILKRWNRSWARRPRYRRHRGTGNMMYLPPTSCSEQRVPRATCGVAADDPPGGRQPGRGAGSARPEGSLMTGRILPILIGAVLAIWLLVGAVFQVQETELAIKFRFGEIVKDDYEPGLHFMVPVINNARKFDRRVLTRNYPSEQFLTSEGKILNVDFYVKWRFRRRPVLSGDWRRRGGRAAAGRIVKAA
jgi:membrane protease subunit HflK